MEKQHFKDQLHMARGIKKANIVVKNINVINVFSKEIIKCDIAISEEKIVGLGEYSGEIEIDGTGKYACPGLIDSHVHIESSMVTPYQFSKAILPHGTTSIVADPHEIANVLGFKGIDYMLEQTVNLPLDCFFMVPSCVPATNFENAGAIIEAEDMHKFVNNPNVLGLGEVMNYPAVISGDLKIFEKIELFKDKVIDGHSPNLSGLELNSYIYSGIMTDHECSTFEEAIQRIRLGMYVQIREGSAAKNLENIITGFLENNISFDRCLFCTDDKHLDDIRVDGHISYNVKKAIKLGVSPIDAICMATINASNCYNIKGHGAIAPGYYANLVILDNLEDFTVKKVMHHGKIVFENDCLIDYPEPVIAEDVLDTINVKSIDNSSLDIKLTSDKVNVIVIKDNELITTKESCGVSTSDGFFYASKEFNKIAVIERHKATGNIGLGIVKNFNIQNGAIATTVAHDSHNLIVIGDNDADMYLAIEELKRVNGGYSVVSNGTVLYTLPLPVAGLMSNDESNVVEEKINVMLNACYKLGVNKNIDPFITLSFLALPVIPAIRVTDKGLFDVNDFKFINIE